MRMVSHQFPPRVVTGEYCERAGTTPISLGSPLARSMFVLVVPALSLMANHHLTHSYRKAARNIGRKNS